MSLLRDGVLAVAEGVPELDGAVAGAGNDLTVVGREGDGEDVVGVANKAAGGGAGGELPEAESLVPRGGQGVGAVRRDDLIQVLAFHSGADSKFFVENIRSPRRCGSGRGASAWGNRTRSHHG